MIIKSLILENFRQYYGRQKIEFAYSDTNQVVTVVLGENGRGKTGIYRAIMLALFGDRKLNQDDKDTDIYLANVKAVDEKSRNGEGVYCKVKLCFEHHNANYLVERVYFAMKDQNGVQKEELHKVRLVNNKTGEEWFSEKDIRNIIQKIIDERVKHYFFFDGERIERLTRVSAQQKREVALGIKNLLKIDQVLKSKQVIQKILTKVKKELEHHSTGDYKKAIREMSQLQQRLEELEKEYGNNEQIKTDFHSRQAEIDDKLLAFESMTENMKERDQLEIQLEHIKGAIQAKLEQANNLNRYLPLLLGENVFHQQIARLSHELSIEVEQGINSEFIAGLLNDLRCICGTTFTKDSIEYQQLTALANSVKRYEENKDLYSVYNSLKQLVSYLEGRVEQVRNAQSEINHLIAEKEQIQYKLDEINTEISESDLFEVKELNKEREQILRELVQIDLKQKLNLEEQQEYKEKIEKLSLKLKELEQQSGIHMQLLKKYNILEKSVETMNRIIKKFEADLIGELELVTKQNLYFLLDQAGNDMLKEVKITQDYTLEVLNHFGQPFLANISQGQRQVLSLSFITALAQVAGGTNVLEMPLFMDTPFGRLSGQHQRNLIEFLPQICSQWVLLVTDKEFGPVEQDQFIEANTVGKFYELVAEEPGVTRIKEIPMSEFVRGVV